MKKVISLLLSLVMIISITAGLDFSANASTNGHTQAEAVAWANNQVGKALDYDGAYGAQCVDLTVYYYVYLGQAAPLGNANQYVNGGKFCPSGWSYQSSPKAGDIAVWTDGPYGHVAIVTEVRSGSYVIVEQNYAGKQYCTPREMYSNASTFIRPDFVNPVPQGSEMSSGYNRVLNDGLYIIANAASPNLKSSIYYLDIEGSARPAAANTNVSLWGPIAESGIQYYDMWYITYSGGFYTIKQPGTNIVLDLSNKSVKSGANVMAFTSNSGSNQKWAISKFGSGYRLQAKCSGFSLDVNGGGTVAGTNIQQYQNNDTNAQKWIFIKHTHQYGAWKVKTAATCTSGGVKTRSCSCGYTEESKTFETGHNWNSGTVTTKPTCTANGVKTYTCKNNSSHTKTALIFPTGHSWDSGTVTTKPTCTTNGIRTYTCKNDSNHTRTEIVYAKGHNYQTFWSKDIDTHYKMCSDCGQKSNVGYHSFLGGVCSVCGYKKVKFPDTNSNGWYYEAVSYVVNDGLMLGYSNGKFGTSDGIKRQDFILILARLTNVNLENYASYSNFPDALPDSYYYNALAWAKATGVSKGYLNGKFGVGDLITREQLVTFLYNYAKIYNYSTSSMLSEEYAHNMYKDYGKVSNFAKPAVRWALSTGVISGKSTAGGKRIAPIASAQRCEVAMMLYNIHQNNLFK